MSHRRSYLSYVLITPARNEEAFIEQTIQSVIHQTLLPTKWVIVDDGSTDSTAEIVNRYVLKYDWLELVQLPQSRDRSFSSKACAFNAAYEMVKNLEYVVIGNLDADISFDEDYCEFLLNKFQQDAKLGVGGTIFKEEGYSSETDSFEGHDHVTGACQLFRKECFEEIGGYTPNKLGGIDWIAVTTARMMGWKTYSFREKAFFHQRHSGTAERSVFGAAFSYGEKDYYLGGHPVWELFRVAYRLIKRPYLIGGIGLALGYAWASVRRVERRISPNLMRFHRREQMLKLRAMLRSVLRLKTIDRFEITPR